MTRFLKLLIVAALAIPAPVSAQLLDPAGRPLDGPRRVSLGITVPLGGPAEAPAKPQLELRATSGDGRDTGAPREAERFYFGAQSQRPPEARIGFTLEAHPQLTLAGQEVPEGRDKLGISTLGVVGIVVAAAAVVGGVLLIQAATAASD